MTAKKRTVRRRRKTAPASVGLAPADTAEVQDRAVAALAGEVQADGGVVLATYREPFGGTPVLFTALPVDRVEPTPFQRDPSLPHVKRLMDVIEKLGRFLDPIVVIRQDGAYWTPNGNHRLQALRKLGAKTVIALLVPDPEVAFKILALNTEKAHNLKEKSLETIRMERALAEQHAAAPRARLRVRVRSAGVPDARRRLRAAAALERRRVPLDAAPHRGLPRRGGEQGPARARAACSAAPRGGRPGRRDHRRS